LRMHEHADAADVPLPAAELLMERGVADDLAVAHCKQRKVPAQIDVPAPVANHLRLGDTMFDEHAFRLGHGEEELVELLLILAPQRAQRATEPVLQDDVLRKSLDFEFK